MELEDSETGAKQIYSAGKSEKGMLGQGDKVKESREFKKIFYESDDLVHLDIPLLHATHKHLEMVLV